MITRSEERAIIFLNSTQRFAFVVGHSVFAVR